MKMKGKSPKKIPKMKAGGAVKCAKGGCMRLAAGGGAYCELHRPINVKK